MNNQTQEALRKIRAIMIKHGYQNRIMAEEIIEALEQPAQDPVAWMDKNNYVFEKESDIDSSGIKIPLYTHPHQWQGLTDDVVASIWMHEAVPMNGQDFKRVYRAIEQALRERNCNDSK